MNSPFQFVVPAAMTRRTIIISWTLQVLVAVILSQTLFFKFTAAEESVYIFTKLDMEPWGRIGSGVAELIACALLLVPQTVTGGALLTLCIISGAIVSHLTRLGIVVKDDGGMLFGLALISWLASAVILFLRRHEALQRITRWRGARLETTGHQVAR